ncbi:alpha/beta fold hydrolase [Sorangium cellulosum]|uniref:alpha/beta fold hydrolase n=1 Tax=Sorangium TaxID=39643 RepID=UPI0009D66DC9
MTTWISGVCETNGIDIHYLRAGGAGYPVVLLHDPRVRIEQVQDAGHGLPFQQPERLGEVVLSFLRELKWLGSLQETAQR